MALHRLRVATVVVALCLASAPGHADGPTGLDRKIVLKQDAGIPGYETVVAEVTLAPGGREGRHWHAASLVAYVVEGELTLERDGQPTTVVGPGEAVLVAPRQVHEGINQGSVPVRALVTFTAEAGEPLTTAAQ